LNDEPQAILPAYASLMRNESIDDEEMQIIRDILSFICMNMQLPFLHIEESIRAVLIKEMQIVKEMIISSILLSDSPLFEDDDAVLTLFINVLQKKAWSLE
jgi:hypothetical protein